MRVRDLAAVRNVQAPYLHAATGCADGAGFQRLFGIQVLVEAGLAEVGLHVRQAHARQDGYAIKAVQPEVGLLVARVSEVGELLVRAFGLLQAQHVHVAALQKLAHPLLAGAYGVDVPGGDAHG